MSSSYEPSVEEIARDTAPAATPAEQPPVAAAAPAAGHAAEKHEHAGLGHKIKDFLTGHHHHDGEHHHDAVDKAPGSVEQRAGDLGATQELGAKTKHEQEVGYGAPTGLAAAQGVATGANLPRVL